jgi:hypothetical protein
MTDAIHATPNALQHMQGLGNGRLAGTVLAQQQRRMLALGLQLEVLKSLEVVDVQTLQHAGIFQ